MTREPTVPTPAERAFVVHENGAFDLGAGALVPLSALPAEGGRCPCGSGAPVESCPDGLMGLREEAPS